MKFESSLDFFILFIVLIKLLFLLSAVGHVVLTHLPKTLKLDIDDAKLLYWKERTEFIFVSSMSILLIYHFRPGHNKHISSESALLFFLFGCISIITAKWNIFFAEAKWYKTISASLQ